LTHFWNASEPLPLLANPQILLEHVHIVLDHRHRHLSEEAKDCECRSIKPERVWDSENTEVRLREQLPCLEGFPPTMEPVEIAYVMGKKDGLVLNSVFELFGIG
jgi:hypothetical protein